MTENHENDTHETQHMSPRLTLNVPLPVILSCLQTLILLERRKGVLGPTLVDVLGLRRTPDWYGTGGRVETPSKG